MGTRHRTVMIEFDQDHHARAVFVRKDVEPQVLLSLLNLTPLTKGIISVSGGAKDFPPEIEDSIMNLFEDVIVPLAYERNLLIIDGGTELGVVKIIGKVYEQIRFGTPIILGDEKTPIASKEPEVLPSLMGFVPRGKIFCPGIDQSTRNSKNRDPKKLDPNHTHFVMVLYARDWGSEVECMFSFIHYLSTRKKIPVVNIVANGGRVTLKEAHHATQRGWPVIVLEGSKRAAQMIISALDGAGEDALIKGLKHFKIVRRKSELPETVNWLADIARYDKITRFDFMNCSHDDLREIILSRLGFV